MEVKMRHVNTVRAKGRTYYYHRRTGERLPDDPLEAALRAREINAGVTPSTVIMPGSFRDLVVTYKSSPGFASLKDRTRRDYARCLDIILNAWADLLVAALKREHVMEWRDHHGQTNPARGNQVLGVLRLLLTFALDRGFRPDNPTLKIKPLKMGSGHKPWPPAAIPRFKAAAGPEMRLALLLGLYTGQRKGDVLTMTWHDYDGAWIKVVQAKTGIRLDIPVHPELKAALDSAPRRSPIILTTPSGRPFRHTSFDKHWRRVILAAGLDGLVFHGLRYTAASELAELGCSDAEIASITGHLSRSMVVKYSKGARQKKLASAAIGRWGKAQNKNKTAKLGRTGLQNSDKK